MRIESIRIENIRGIELAEVPETGNTVVIAGPNGCGKTCLLDAIRTFKSLYGGYDKDERQHMFNLRQINMQDKKRNMGTLLRDKSKPGIIRAEISFSDEEKTFLRESGHGVIRERAWRMVFPQIDDPWLKIQGQLGQLLKQHRKAMEQTSVYITQELTRELGGRTTLGEISISPGGNCIVQPNRLLEVVFSSFVPEDLGVIDFHESHRLYTDEVVTTVNMTPEKELEKWRSGLLYNTANKYQGLKSTMAGEYVRELLMRNAGHEPTQDGRKLSEILEEMFGTFLPGKKFRGPTPTQDGKLEFPVEIGGVQHDINELSSGEKEIVFGYLRARTAAPRNSVLLVDEPELHLNPALVRGLPQFYRKHIGEERQNQIWLVTHSDIFLREALDTPGITVYHMQQAGVRGGENQIRKVSQESEFDAICIELVGDVAGYRPGSKIVLLEGENSEFDTRMVERLFPEFASILNFVSAGSKGRVQEVHNTLEQLSAQGKLRQSVHSIVDPDDEIWKQPGKGKSRRHTWDVYHIENYLLIAEFIAVALEEITLHPKGTIVPEVIEAYLEKVARESAEIMARAATQQTIRRELIRSITVARTEGEASDEEVAQLVSETQRMVQDQCAIYDTAEKIERKTKLKREELTNAVQTGEWKKLFPGRPLLRKLAGKFAPGVRYEVVRNAIIANMARQEYKPTGMENILKKIERE